MTNTTAPALYSLQLVYTRPNQPISTSDVVPVASPAEAHKRLGWALSSRLSSVVGHLTDPSGRYAGTGLAEPGRVVSDWA